MLGKCLWPEIERLIKQRDFDQLRGALLELGPLDIAEVIADVPPRDKAIIFRLLPKMLAADVVEQMQPIEQRRLIHSLGQQEVAQVLRVRPKMINRPDDRPGSR